MTNCNICGDELPWIHPDIEDPYHKINKKPVCNDCFFNALGDIIKGTVIKHS